MGLPRRAGHPPPSLVLEEQGSPAALGGRSPKRVTCSGRRWTGLKDPKESPFPTAAMDQQAESGHCLFLPPQLGLGWVSPHYGEAGSAIRIRTDSMGRLSGCCGCTCPGSITPQPLSPCRGDASRAGAVSCCNQAAARPELSTQFPGSTCLLPAPQSTQYHGAPSCQVPI